MNTLTNPGADTLFAGSINGANANGGAYNHYTFSVTQNCLLLPQQELQWSDDKYFLVSDKSVLFNEFNFYC